MNRTTTIGVLLIGLASFIGYRSGFFGRLGGAISGVYRVNGT